MGEVAGSTVRRRRTLSGGGGSGSDLGRRSARPLVGAVAGSRRVPPLAQATRVDDDARQADVEEVERMHIARLTATDAPQYRELMLEAYVEAADAFTSTAEERLAEPLSWWVQRIAAHSGISESFGAFEDQRLFGAVALQYSAKPKTRHSALVIGMYVKPAARRLGTGALLMQAVVAEARSRPGLRLLRLTVTEGNETAIRLYESVGFSTWGVEPQAIRTSSGYKAKVHMCMQLASAEAAV